MDEQVVKIQKWLEIIGIKCDDNLNKLITDPLNKERVYTLCNKYQKKLEYLNLLKDSITFHYINDAYETDCLKSVFKAMNFTPNDMSIKGKQAHKILINAAYYLPRVASNSLNLLEYSLEILLHKYFAYQIKIHENDVAEKELHMQLKEIEELPEIIDSSLKQRLVLPRLDIIEDEKLKETKESTPLNKIYDAIKGNGAIKSITTHEAIDNFHLRLKELMDKIDLVITELEVYKSLPKDINEAKKILAAELAS